MIRAASVELNRGDVLAGRYQVEAVLGKGGSGVVLRAFDRVAQVPVALKILKAELARDPRWLERLSRELRLGRQIQHPNVCRIFDIREADGHWFLTMELASNGTLRDDLQATATVRPLEARIADTRALVAGLEAIHGAGIVHRDIKPDNLLRMTDGRLVVSDFGLATTPSEMGAVTIMVGTPTYMAPEVVMGEPATVRSDVWSVGVVMHEILFGQKPVWERRGARKTLQLPLGKTASAMETALGLVCERCLADAPADRPANAAAVATLLDTAQTSPRALRRRSRQARSRLWAGGVIIVTLAGLALARNRLWNAATAGLATHELAPIQPMGVSRDLTPRSHTIATVDGRVHCFSLVDGAKTARVVWGEPRRAEDFSLASGARRAAPLVSATFQTGCPQFSPTGHGILFSAFGDEGPVQLRYSESPTGHPSSVVTTGDEPLWLPNGDEFVYSLDSFHAAIYSMSTRSFSLIPQTDFGSHNARLANKAVNSRGDRVALSFVDDEGAVVIAIHGAPGYHSLKQFILPTPTISSITFGTDGEVLNLAYLDGASYAASVELDWRTGRATRKGYFAGLDVVSLQPVDGGQVGLLRRKSWDAWSYNEHGRQRLTFDGNNLSASLSPAGELLVGKVDAQARYAVWSQRPGGPAKKVTPGPTDVSPQFSPNGDRWAYADDARMDLMVCDNDARCRAVHHDDMLPATPVFSPDGASLAYLTQLGTPRLMVVDLSDGRTRDFGPTLSDCPPVWTSSDRVWSHQGAGNAYFWLERDVTTGEKTGRRIEAPKGAGPDGSSTDQCAVPGASTSSPFFRRVRTETTEVSRLVGLP